MANYYWVGGNGTWNTSNSANWSSTSGGTGGAGVPGQNDSAIFDTNSGSATVTVSGTVTVGAFQCNAGGTTPFGGTINLGSSTIRIAPNDGVASANIRFSSNMTFNTGTGTISWEPQWATPYGNCYFYDKSIYRLVINAANPAATFRMNTSLLCGINNYSASGLFVYSGTVYMNGYQITSNEGVTFSGSSSKTIYCSNSTIAVYKFVTDSGASNLTLDAASATINIYNGTSYLSIGSTQSIGTLRFGEYAGYDSASSTYIYAPNVTFGTIALTSTNLGLTYGVLRTINLQSNIYASSVSLAGYNGICRVRIKSNSSTVRTITTSSASIGNNDFSYISFSIPVSGTSVATYNTCQNITISEAKTCYWNYPAGTSIYGNAWASSNGGAVNPANFPLPQDYVYFTTNQNANTTVSFYPPNLSSSEPWYVTGINCLGFSSGTTRNFSGTVYIKDYFFPGDGWNGSNVYLRGLGQGAITFGMVGGASNNHLVSSVNVMSGGSVVGGSSSKYLRCGSFTNSGTTYGTTSNLLNITTTGTFYNYSTVSNLYTINASSLINYGTMSCYSSITASSISTYSGSMSSSSISASGGISNSGGTVSTGAVVCGTFGDISNTGTFNCSSISSTRGVFNYSGASMTVTGNINDTDSVNNYSSLTANYITSSYQINNYAGGVLTPRATFSLTSPEITNNGTSYYNIMYVSSTYTDTSSYSSGKSLYLQPAYYSGVATYNSTGNTYCNVYIISNGLHTTNIIGNPSNLISLATTNTLSHTINLIAGSYTLNSFSVTGTSGNVIYLGTYGSGTHTITNDKTIFERITTDYLNIQNSSVLPANTWYAGSHSVDSGGNSGWIFSDYNPNAANGLFFGSNF